jgi:hypothetical protein
MLGLVGKADLFIYFISFNVFQPMWLCRQNQTHKIADMQNAESKPINKRRQNNTRNTKEILRQSLAE